MATAETKQRPRVGSPKRMIMCCDGTWQDSLGKKGSDPPTNVTRMSRALRRTCSDGTPQIITYFPGVGSGNVVDRYTGGIFGVGLDNDIREVYNFVCTNYVDGDAIVLTGFSRGAFTARSVADMIASVGLLTPAGMQHFYDVFEDYEGIKSTHRDPAEYVVPGLPAYRGEEGKERLLWEERRLAMYMQGLKEMEYTRYTYQDGVTEIKIKALAVWDTVGSLGIPPAPVIGISGSANQWKFTNTQISAKVENAFQALALDEPRYAFRPALWERINGNATNLRQVWFPGSHANVGGSWPDQQIANITLAWMCDQLSTVGVEFNLSRMTSIFIDGLRFSAAHPFPYAPTPTSIPFIPHFISDLWPSHPAILPWASPPIFRPPPGSHPSPLHRDTSPCSGEDQHPSGSLSQLQSEFSPRPWSLGQTRYPTNMLLVLAGTAARTPGRTTRVKGDSNIAEDDGDQHPLLRTGERVHSSVRVRLACRGLGMDDGAVWRCEPLTEESHGGRLWVLERGSGFSAGEEGVPIAGFRPRELDLGDRAYPERYMYPMDEGDSHWRWVFEGTTRGVGEERVPQTGVLPEEPMVGYWERYLLAMTAGQPDVWRWAQQNPPVSGSAF